MLRWSIIFILIAIVGGVLGFAGVPTHIQGIAQVCFFVGMALFIGSLVARNFVHGHHHH
ncbi:DUF1328 domain-containing protein [Pseudoflavitalea sp. G-6-1-2]|nr:DUF1328 domain-containing protein [Pseudoflavitalea sp. G-6-1-2]